MRELLKTNRFFLLPAIISLTALFVSVVILGLKFQSLPPEVPLLYSRPWGEERLVAKIWLWLAPGSALVILVFNFLLANMLVRRDLFLAQALTTATTLVVFLLLWTLLKITFLVS